VRWFSKKDDKVVYAITAALKLFRFMTGQLNRCGQPLCFDCAFRR
jgi:hypothetical protein